MRLVPVTHLKENSIISLNVLDNEGRLMLKGGQKITSQGIQILNKLGVAYVYIQDEYCFHQPGKVNKGIHLDDIYTNVQTLKGIGDKIVAGTSGAEDIATATNIASEIVDDMLLFPSDIEITYEPTKLVANSLIEEGLYVAMMATLLGVKMGLSKEKLVKLCLASLLKDVALLSPKIKKDNIASYKLHPQIAYDYLKATYNLDEEILLGILQHHEYHDGSGFPNKLHSYQISQIAKIISLVDTFYEIKSTHAFLDSTEMLFEAKLKKVLLKFDTEMITYFIRHAEVFRPDTLVRLNNNDLAVVHQNNPQNPFKPIIRIIRSSIYEEGTIVNLHESKLVIKHIEYYVEG